METEEISTESDAELGTDTDAEKGAGAQPQPAKEVEVEFSMPLAAVLKSTFQNGGEAAVRGMVDGMLSRRGTPSAPAGEQTALRAAMDELEEDPSDEAGRILNIIFSCFDAVELAREEKYPNKIEKLTSELMADIARMRAEGAFDRDDNDDDDKWGPCDINGDPWTARETDNTPKRPDCDD